MYNKEIKATLIHIEKYQNDPMAVRVNICLCKFNKSLNILLHSV